MHHITKEQSESTTAAEEDLTGAIAIVLVNCPFNSCARPVQPIPATGSCLGLLSSPFWYHFPGCPTYLLHTQF